MARIIGIHATVDVDPTDPKAAITKLKQMGFRVFVSHKRWAAGDRIPTSHDASPAHTKLALREMGRAPSPKGGATTVRITDNDGVRIVTGVAHCAHMDNFNRNVGTQIALGRAVKQLATMSGLSRDHRRDSGGDGS